MSTFADVLPPAPFDDDDLRFSVDHLLEEGREPGRFEGLYQEDAYGVIGHSFGTITAMRLGGGEVDWPGMTAVCEQGQGKGQNKKIRGNSKSNGF